jgi:arylsulfatase A-like enzyme
MAREFRGTINLDIQDSIEDWEAFLAPKPPPGAPNVLVVLYDDTGCAAWSPYGGRINRGILPEGTELTPLNPMTPGTFAPGDMVRPWDSLSDEEKRLFSRMAEVYAGFSEYTDAQVGRIVDYLEQSGQLENTLILYCADNGASGEGSPNGSVNENKIFNAYPDRIEDNLPLIDQLGSPNTYNHYPTGWAVAFSTPYRMFKRYCYQGGVADPLVIHWPAGIKARGEVRHQYRHSTDIVPTILECCGVEMPRFVNGAEQTPLPGVSMRYSFDDADAPTQKVTQYYEMLGARGLWHQGWKVVTEHGPLSGGGAFEHDTWQLFHTDEDRSEAHDVADQHPDKVEQLKAMWYAEAGKYNVLPLNSYPMSGPKLLEFFARQYHVAVPKTGTYTYYPGTSEVPEHSAANTHLGSFRILAEVELTDPDAQGVIFAQGSRFGGHAMFIKDHRLIYTYNFLGIGEEQQFSADVPSPGRYLLGVDFTKETVGEHREPTGTTKLYIGDEAVAEGPMKTLPVQFSLCGEGLCIGYDGGDAVSRQYTPTFPFTGGEISRVTFNVADESYQDIETRLAALIARD